MPFLNSVLEWIAIFHAGPIIDRIQKISKQINKL